ncbi:MAG: cation transporter [Alphaproteobacteria bacterium]|nr:MAG: cation transporter [Alphaproteobacteria bacterium]
MHDCCAHKGKELERLARQADQKRVLVAVLLLNAAMFVAEFGAGIAAGSAALMADSVDMFGDALVYGISLYAISRSDRWKAGVALGKGLLILAFGIGVAVQIGGRLETGAPPSSLLMTVFGTLALAVNLACVRLLWRFRTQDVNMSSVFECSRNDVISNCGVLAAAGAVAATGSPWPDIAIGAVIALIFLRSAVRVIGSALPTLRTA